LTIRANSDYLVAIPAMSLPQSLNELLHRARQVIATESAAVLSATESLDQKFVDVAQLLLACSANC
jgi:hypothetical protein